MKKAFHGFGMPFFCTIKNYLNKLSHNFFHYRTLELLSSPQSA